MKKDTVIATVVEVDPNSGLSTVKKITLKLPNTKRRIYGVHVGYRWTRVYHAAPRTLKVINCRFCGNRFKKTSPHRAAKVCAGCVHKL